MAVKRYFRGKQRGKRENGRKRKVFFMHFMQKILHKMLVICKKSRKFAADLRIIIQSHLPFDYLQCTICHAARKESEMVKSKNKW